MKGSELYLSEYTAKDIVSLSAGQAFRSKIGMYLSADRQEAINLGLRELIVNVQDEYEVYKRPNSFCKITLNTTTREISVEDNARGIPSAVRDDGMNSLTAAFLIPHSGGKHNEGAYVSSIGINGEGNKVVCHTAKWLEVYAKRDGNQYYQRFESDDNGAHPLCDVKVLGKTKETGTLIKYEPDSRVYGDIFIHQEKLKKMLNEMSYFTKGMKIILNVDGQEEIFFSKNGLVDGLVADNAISAPFSYLYSVDDCEVELALQWVAGKGDIKGYANGLFMPNGGAFISGFKSSLTRTFNNLADDKFDGDMIRKMLDGFVSVKVKVGQFSNQAKTALANPEARTATATAITNALKEFYKKNKSDFEKIVEVLRREQKADAAAQKAREAALAKVKVFSNKKEKIRKAALFVDCEKHGDGSTLILTEGNSTKGTIEKAKDKFHEALYPLRGKIINLLCHPLNDCLENDEVHDICTILGCGIQEHYNSGKLEFERVLMAPDADADGFNIMCLIATMFYVLMPKFIEEGRLCWLRAPLYKLEKGKQIMFAYDAAELAAISKGREDWKQTRFKGLGEMCAEDARRSMFDATNRRIDVLTPEDEDDFKQLVMLMGDDVEARKEFIFNNLDFENALT